MDQQLKGIFITKGLTNVPTTTTASYALTASYVETSQTASYVETAQTASYVISSSIEGITNYVRNDQTTGSFSGSYVGDGSGLTGVSATFTGGTVANATTFNSDVTINSSG